jgi:hypothetical protein
MRNGSPMSACRRRGSTPDRTGRGGDFTRAVSTLNVWAKTSGKASREPRPRAVRSPDERLAVWIFYGIGLLAIAYLALFAYNSLTGHPLVPGDPIHIFRKPDAPSYS